MNVRIFHPRRSGGHAVIFWLLRSAESYAFYNSLPLSSATPKLPREKTPGVPAHLFWSHEDPNRSDSLPRCVASHRVQWLPRPDHDVFIVRDFYNYAASKLRSGERRGESFSASWRDCDTRVWTEFAEMFCEKPGQFVVFNKWLCDKAYRDEVAERYGMAGAPYDTEIPDYGGGSSFTGMRQPADRDALLTRFRGMEREVVRLCSERAKALNEQIFGWSL